MIDRSLCRVVFVLYLFFMVVSNGFVAEVVREPSREEIRSEWVVQGTEDDAIYLPDLGQATEADAIYREGVREGGEFMAVVRNEPPADGRLLRTGDVIAPSDEEPGERPIPGPERFVPGGIEPGVYDGTKDTGPFIWRMDGFLSQGGKVFRFLGDRVFRGSVEVVEHTEPRWVWGSHGVETIQHETAWQRVRVGEELVSRRRGTRPSRRFVEYRVERRLWTNPEDPDAEPVMTSVSRPVYERILAPVYQRYKVPVYEWQPVTVRTTDRSTSLRWIKRYRHVLGTYMTWRYWGSFDDWSREHPRLVTEARRARAVTERVLKERRQLMDRVSFERFRVYVSTERPADDPKEEFFLRHRKQSVDPLVTFFVENDVPDTELVRVPPSSDAR